MKVTNVLNFIRRDIINYDEYKPVPSAWDMKAQQKTSFYNLAKLDAGENTFGPSPKVIQALARFDGYQFYPDPEYRELRSMLATYTGVPADSIVIGSGGDEIIDLLSRLTLEPNDEIITCPPTFSTYIHSAELSFGKVVSVPRNPDFSVNTDAIIKAVTKKTKIIYICNPNNPTGNVTSLDEIEKILQLDSIVVVDEAYFEFCKITAALLLKRYSNLVIIRSLSKWAGVAGLRIGYGLLHRSLASQLMKIKQPYNVNTAAEVAARAALKDSAYYRKTIATIIRERKKMYAELKKLRSISVLPSDGNYLFVQPATKTLSEIKKAFEKKCVALRYYKDGMRITIGRPEQNKIVTNIFKSL